LVVIAPEVIGRSMTLMVIHQGLLGNGKSLPLDLTWTQTVLDPSWAEVGVQVRVLNCGRALHPLQTHPLAEVHGT